MIHKFLVCGAGGFIGGHLVKKLLDEEIKKLEQSKTTPFNAADNLLKLSINGPK